MNHSPLLPRDWDPLAAADRVLAGLQNVCLPRVRGAHDSDFLIVDDTAYIVYMANDVQPGEDARWPYVYIAMTTVDLRTGATSHAVTVAAGGMPYRNVTLPPGACFVPRLIQKNDHTLRCFFASEEPGQRQAQTWIIDFDLRAQAFVDTLQPMQMRTGRGVFPMQPRHFHDDAVDHGFVHKTADYGLYFIDGFKTWDGKTYAVVNNFITRQNALGVMSESLDCVTILGHFIEPFELQLSEAAVQKMPDGTFLAIARQEAGTYNYHFSSGPDGVRWSACAPRDHVPNGGASKPTFDFFGGVYYLGWQESTRYRDVTRSVFNVDVSRDGKLWERKYRFQTEKSFQYPTFREHNGSVFLTVTQGDHSGSRKERIMFGRLE